MRMSYLLYKLVSNLSFSPSQTSTTVVLPVYWCDEVREFNCSSHRLLEFPTLAFFTLSVSDLFSVVRSTSTLSVFA